METLKIGIITTSDRASAGVYEAVSWSKIQELMAKYVHNPCEFDSRIIPDEQPLIEETLKDLADNQYCSLIITTGGTGPAKRDLTVEATEAVCQKILPGFGELMRQISLKYVPTAILSRQTAGIYNNSLIVNLPGKPSSIELCLEAVFPAIPYCIDLIGSTYIYENELNMKVFRPKN
jgi:molybdopterin adenylyltransferase